MGENALIIKFGIHKIELGQTIYTSFNVWFGYIFLCVSTTFSSKRAL